MSDHPPCYICLGPVPRRKTETRWTWMRRPTCSRPCGWQYQNLENKERYAQAVRDHLPCPGCTRPVIPRKREGCKAYQKRQYCSKSCSSKFKKVALMWDCDRVAELEGFLDKHSSPPDVYIQAAEHFGCTKNAIAGAVHRHCVRREPLATVVIEFPYQGCMWPHGHPNEEGFHFCGAKPFPGKPYCGEHCAIAYYLPPKAVES
jgi:hypothetical protein